MNAVLWLALMAVAPSEPAADAFAAQARLFEYDRRAPLAVREVSSEKRGAVSVRDVVFRPVPGRPEVKAYVVRPDGAGPFAGVLWMHWLGDPATTNRTQFLDEAVALAARGVVSVLPDAMWAAPDWYGKRVLAEDRANSIAQVVAIRRAMDLLAREPGVDAARLGFVGHDYGGMYGMIAAGVDRRAKAYVYVAVTSSLNDWAFFANQPASKQAYLRENADLELSDYVRQVKDASTLFQFASHDEYVAKSDTIVVFNAASQPKERRFYDGDHGMNVPKAREDRAAWLAEKLGLNP
jgi:dienelactone hydrolase